MNYEVLIPTTYFNLYEVEAESEEEAKRIAGELLFSGNTGDELGAPAPNMLPMEQWEVEQR